MPDVLIEVSDGVALLTLNRPEVRNVFSAAMGSELGAAYARCDADDDIRVVVVTGAGDAFCAGADMTPSAKSFGSAGAGFTASPVQPPAWAVRKPVIAAINGHAVGIGLTLALQCDLRLVALEAKLAIPQVRRGVLPDMGSHWTLRHATSQAVAADVLLTGRTFLGEEAVRLGIASRALPAAEVLTAAMETARDIAVHCAPASLAMTKRLLWGGLSRDATVDAETAFHRLLLGGADAVEGPTAWVERRPPVWTTSVSDVWSQVEESGA